MDLVKYTDYDGLKYALSKFLSQIDNRYLTSASVDLLLYVNPNMSEVTTVKEGLDTLTVNVIGLVDKANKTDEALQELIQADIDTLNQAKAYTNEAINNQTRLKFAFVEELPTDLSEISTSTIYLLRDKNAENDIYSEYIYVNDWELIGTTKTDLSDYYTKTEINAKFTEVQGKLDKKVDKQYGKTLIDESELIRLSKIKDYDDTEVRDLIDDKADDTFKAPYNTVIEVGGIKENTDLNNLSIHQVLNRLLFPHVPPVVTNTLYYSPKANLYEYGQVITVTGIKVNMKRKSNPLVRLDIFSNYLLHDTITQNITNGTEVMYTFQTPINVTLPATTDYFNTEVTDDTGYIVKTGTVAFNFAYPMFYGVVDADVIPNADQVKSLSKIIQKKGATSCTYSPNFQCMVFAYPFSYGKLKSILDPNGFEMINAYTCTEVDIVCGDKSIQKYYVYHSGPSTNNNFKMTYYF